MNKLTISIAAIVVVASSLLLFQATRAERVPVLTPSELTRLGMDSRRNRIRVAGRIAQHAIVYEIEPKLVLTFAIEDPETAAQQASIPVVYHGVKPDMFGPGRNVILEGSFFSGTFTASKLMTQCPSKYEPPGSG